MHGYAARIPAVLVALNKELKAKGGYAYEGVFRVAASKDDQKFYKQLLDEGEFSGCKPEDVMCMAALIKEWFRSLPVSLLNCMSRDTIVRAAKVDSPSRIAPFLLQLPEPNYSVFLYLLDILAQCAKMEDVNRMSQKALAIVLAPNLYQVPNDASPMEMIAMMENAVSVVKLALAWRIQQLEGAQLNLS